MKNKNQIITNIVLLALLIFYPQIANAHLYAVENFLPFVFGFPIFIVAIIVFLIIQQFDKGRAKNVLNNLLNFFGLYFIIYAFSFILCLWIDIGQKFNFYLTLDITRVFLVSCWVIGAILILINKVKIKAWPILITLPALSLAFTYYYSYREQLYVRQQTQVNTSQSADKTISSDALVSGENATMCQDGKSMVYQNHNKLFYYTLADKRDQEIYTRNSQGVSAGSSLIFALSPDCKIIAIADGEMNQQLNLVSINGKVIHSGQILTSQKDIDQYQLTDPTESYIRSLNFSPDGKQIAFVYEVNKMQWASAGKFIFRIGLLNLDQGKWSTANNTVKQDISPDTDITQIDSPYSIGNNTNPEVLFAPNGQLATYRSTYGQRDDMNHSNWILTQSIPPTKSADEHYYWLKNYFRWTDPNYGIDKLINWNGDNEFWVVQGAKIIKVVVNKSSKGAFGNTTTFYDKGSFYQTTWSPEIIKTESKKVNYQFLQLIGDKILTKRTITFYTKNLESTAEQTILDQKNEILLIDKPVSWAIKQ